MQRQLSNRQHSVPAAAAAACNSNMTMTLRRRIISKPGEYPKGGGSQHREEQRQSILYLLPSNQQLAAIAPPRPSTSVDINQSQRGRDNILNHFGEDNTTS
jgi:hypothetical protein